MDATLHALTANIVSAYVGNNTAPASDLPGLISTVYGALSQAGAAVEEKPAREPAVPVKKSITPDYLVCLEDGKKVKMLKRHLRSAYDMSPADYRAKWGLPADYPMVAPNYAATRSEMAKRIGLGKKTAQ
ncbi:MucR family transcriptional regulator [Azospirillum sp. TSO5]|uniref:MucR family transcriptional regulator n=1 Tax=Azospirillum sp. TSO5 TaxID=716760 RepID=UPI000D608D7E|nr:MucR family transcriptional regulator [Azospirillum sp. TSO5]PWC98030.1 MucR family transcriptional regulator [Azospirillum sp. TSO5]